MEHEETPDSVKLMRSRYWEFYNPAFSMEHNLDMAVGAVQWRDQVIANLRKRIAYLEQQDQRGDQ